MKNLLVLSTLIILLSTSCKKDLIEKYEESKAKKTAVVAQSVSELKVATDFDWKTNRKVSLNLKGAVTAPLIITTEAGEVVYKCMLKANQPLPVEFAMAASVTKLNITYLGKVTSVEVKSGVITAQL